MRQPSAASDAAITSVLHPTDLSPASEVAFAHALKIALAGKTRLHILHAKDSEGTPNWDRFPSVRATLAKWSIVAADTRREDVDKQAGIKVAKTELHSRDPVATMVGFLNAHDCDFMVLATHGREGLSRWLNGSVAEPLARRGQIKALFLPEGARGFVDPADGSLRLAKVLIPVDRAPRPEPAAETVATLTRMLGATPEIQLLHIGERDSAPAVQHLSGTLEVRTGPVVDEILAGARAFDADLIALTTAGHQDLFDALRGSTSERVLRQAPCAVLVVPAAVA
jgi:nucleotide-binding universal stress UspA family protein